MLQVGGKLHGAAGAGGVDAVTMKNWITRFGLASVKLREELAQWADWLCNTSPSWAAYRGLMACRLVALDKCPGVRPVGIGEIIRRLLAKLVLKVAGAAATEACGNLQLCAGLQPGIEGAIHAVRELSTESGLRGGGRRRQCRATTGDASGTADWETDDGGRRDGGGEVGGGGSG